jgi:hypothetical protein
MSVDVKIRVALSQRGDPALLEVWLPRTEYSERHVRAALDALPARAIGTFVVHTDLRTVAHAKLVSSDGSPLSQHRMMQLLGTLRERLETRSGIRESATNHAEIERSPGL